MNTFWTISAWYGRLRRNRTYSVEIENVYKRRLFPMWMGFLWTPRYNPKKQVSFTTLRAKSETVHLRARKFFDNTDPDVLGNIYGWDPVIGVVNLIQALKVGIDHDQLHYDDVFKLANLFKGV